MWKPLKGWIAGGVLAATLAALCGCKTTAPGTGGSAGTNYQAPCIVMEPLDRTVHPGSTVVLRVRATGTAPLHYQWRLNGDEIPMATDSILVLRRVQRTNCGGYDVVVRNQEIAVSRRATVRLDDPVVTLADNFDRRFETNSLCGSINGSNVGATQEKGEPQHAGTEATNSVWLAWRSPQRGIVTFDTTGSAFDTVLAVYTGKYITALTPVADDDDSGPHYTSSLKFNVNPREQYQIAIAGSASAAGNIVFNWKLEPTTDELPNILLQPTNQIVAVGGFTKFSVVAFNPPPYTNAPLTYQWKLDGMDLCGATNAVFYIGPARTWDVGMYSCVVSNPCRGVETKMAALVLASFTSVQEVPVSGSLTAPIGLFKGPSGGFSSSFNKCYTFYTNAPPFGYEIPAGKTKLTVDTFDPANTPFDTGIEIFQRPGLASVGTNDNLDSTTKLSRKTINTVAGSNYRFGLYVRGPVPIGTTLVVNFLFHN